MWLSQFTIVCSYQVGETPLQADLNRGDYGKAYPIELQIRNSIYADNIKFNYETVWVVYVIYETIPKPSQ